MKCLLYMLIFSSNIVETFDGYDFSDCFTGHPLCTMGFVNLDIMSICFGSSGWVNNNFNQTEELLFGREPFEET